MSKRNTTYTGKLNLNNGAVGGYLNAKPNITIFQEQSEVWLSWDHGTETMQIKLNGEMHDIDPNPGILCGKRDLIAAAALQHLDQDVYFELWHPPPSLIDKDRLPGAPQHGLGLAFRDAEPLPSGPHRALVQQHPVFQPEGPHALTEGC